MCDTLDNPDDLLICDYIKQLDSKEKKAIDIARDQLQSSFDITKSTGFIKWIEQKNKLL